MLLDACGAQMLFIQGQSFSAMLSEYKRPIDNKWDEDSLVITNASDVMRAIQFIIQNVAVDIKILDYKNVRSNVDEQKSSSKRKRKAKNDSDEEDSSDDE